MSGLRPDFFVSKYEPMTMMKGRSFGISQSRSAHGLKEFYNWEFEEDDERKAIHNWSKDRIKKMHGLRKSYHSFLVYSFTLSTIKSFFENFNIIVILQMMIAAGAVFLFDKYDISFEYHVALFVSPIVFPLAFSINTDFQRREKVLDDLASFKSGAMLWFFCMREWREAAELDEQWLNAVQKKVHSMMFNLREYLLTDKLSRRNMIARYMYEDFSDTSQLIERVRSSKLPANTSIVSRVIHLLNSMCVSFERLRVIREYRSPRSIRSFNKVLILLLPIILGPYFVSLGNKHKSTSTQPTPWFPYVIAILVSGVFGSLQGVQDKLDDPFDGMSEDDINLDTIDEWTFTSLDTTAKRNFKVGRFVVSANVNDPETCARVRAKSIAEYLHKQEDFAQDEQTDCGLTVKKSPFHNRKSMKGLFRRSTKSNSSKKRRSINRSHTFGIADNRRQSRSSTSSYIFAPEQHPFADVLETMSGDTKITRKHTVRHHPIGTARSISLDETVGPIPRKEEEFKSISNTSLVSILKEVKEETNSDFEKKEHEVKFSPEHEMRTYDLSKRKKVSSCSDSPSKEPLLPHIEAHKTNNRFNLTNIKQKQISFELPGASDNKINGNSLIDSDELQQVVVVNSINGHHDNDVFS